MSTAIKFPTGFGSKDTNKNTGRDYATITAKEIAAMAANPPSTPKEDAQWIIPSTYHAFDARVHDKQREAGQFHLICFDFDEGSPTLEQVKAALVAVFGQAAIIIYATASAQPGKLKWRAIVFVTEAIPGAEFSEVMNVIYGMVEAHGVKLDYALTRPAQLVYLPNRGDHYQFKLIQNPALRSVDAIPGFPEAYAARKDYLARTEAQTRAEAEKRAAERALRADMGEVSPTDWFNAHHDVEQVMLQYGYERAGKDYKSPQSTTNSYAVRVFDQAWVSLSGSDYDSGIGAKNDACCWGDAYDLYVHYEHSGNHEEAWRAIGKMMPKEPRVDHTPPDFAGLEDMDDCDRSVAKPNPEPAQDDEAKFNWPTPLAEINPAALPRRQWVYGNAYIRKFVTVSASAGGIGKTSFTSVEGVAIATGRPFLNEKVKEQTKVWIINLEDPLEEMQLRMAAIMEHYKIKHSELAGKLFLDAEDTITITLASEARDGIILHQGLLDAMIAKIREHDIGTVIIDPFVSTHTVNENSNASIQAVVAMLRQLARDTGAAVHLVHHVRKGNGEDSTIDSVRGAGSLIGAARAARVFNRVPEDKAIELGFPHDNARGLMRIDDGKANLAPPAERATFAQMVGVKLANGEWVGVATHVQLPDKWEGMSVEIVNAMLALIEQGKDGIPYSARSQDADRWAGDVIMNFDMPNDLPKRTAEQAKTMLKEWLSNGIIEVGDFMHPTQRKNRKGILKVDRVGEVK